MRLRTLGSVVVLALSGVLAACVSSEDVAKSRAQRVAEVTNLTTQATAADTSAVPLATQLSSLQTQITGLVAGSVARAQMEGQAAEVQKSLDALRAVSTAARAQVDKLNAAIARSDSLVADGNAPTNAGTTAGGAVGMFWPGVGGLTALVGGIGWKALRLAQANSALTDSNKTLALGSTLVVKSIDALAHAAPEVASAMQKHSSLLDAVQGAVGKALVDAVQSGVQPPPDDHPVLATA